MTPQFENRTAASSAPIGPTNAEDVFRQWTQLQNFHPVVKLPTGAKKIPLVFTEENRELTPEILASTALFTQYIEQVLRDHHAHFGYGGYAEHRTIYQRSEHFNGAEEPRRLHLGLDIWGAVGTPVWCPYEGKVHSFAFNQQFGDYGATIILEHEFLPNLLADQIPMGNKIGKEQNGEKEQNEKLKFYTLYGHLSIQDIVGLKEGQVFESGSLLAHFGSETDNGGWPPHLHFQVMLDMQGMRGDYPGVCRYSERDKYLRNCMDPVLIDVQWQE